MRWDDGFNRIRSRACADGAGSNHRVDKPCDVSGSVAN